MTIVSKIRLRNFRSHIDSEFDLSPNVTIINGKNGSGKTTIIEAIYCSFRGTSFKGTDKDITNHDSSWWTVETNSDNNTRNLAFDGSKQQKKKKIKIGSNIFYRMPAKHKIPVVLFEPDDLRLLSGSPQRRRKFIDDFISQINPEYQNVIKKFDRALKQRNNLLKQPYVKADDIFVWNVALSEYGSEIINQRVLFIERINKQLPDIYKNIAKTKNEITVHYSNTIIENTKNKLFKDLESNFQRDKILGVTTTGPHRHDVYFYIDSKPAAMVASRGEVRTVILAIKFLETIIINELFNISPTILLDDVFSELDETRQEALSNFTKKNQVVITSTHKVKNNLVSTIII